MSSGSPTREQADLAEVLEMVLDKGIVINADIAVTVGQTELLGIEIRAAIASFETAAKYGLAFPSGTDMQRVERASGRQPLEDEDAEPIDLGIDASSGGSAAEDDDGDGGDGTDEEEGGSSSGAPGRRPTPTVMTGGATGGESAGGSEEETDDEESDADDESDDETDDDSSADDGDNSDVDGGDG